jgi:hypothetical protein
MPRRAGSNIIAGDVAAVPPLRSQHPPNKQLHHRLNLNRNPKLKLPRLRPNRPSKRRNPRAAAGPANLPSNRKPIQPSRRSGNPLPKRQRVHVALNVKRNHPLVPIRAAAGIPAELAAISAAIRQPPERSG